MLRGQQQHANKHKDCASQREKYRSHHVIRKHVEVHDPLLITLPSSLSLDSSRLRREQRAAAGVRTHRRGAISTCAERNSTWSVIVPADGTCAATWRERRLRYVPDLRAALGQATACLCNHMGVLAGKHNRDQAIKRRAASCRPAGLKPSCRFYSSRINDRRDVRSWQAVRIKNGCRGRRVL